jgi:glucosamine-6-phosphate deaminase
MLILNSVRFSFCIMGDFDALKFWGPRIVRMLLKVFPDKSSLSQAAAEQAATAIRNAISRQGRARIVAATAASQIHFLEALTKAPSIDWSKVEAFHLDEYIGLPVTHPGSFRKMLLEQLIQKTGLSKYHLLDGDAPDPAAVARRVSKELASSPVDIEFLGIGENGHVAFNDPPANFEMEDPYIIVELDEACRRQQVGEAWFANISQVPRRALSMSVRQVLKAKEILAVVPDERKAQAIRACFTGEISPMAPASILRTHPNATIYLDKNSASLLPSELREVGEHEVSSPASTWSQPKLETRC